jgi:hypothetical protein
MIKMQRDFNTSQNSKTAPEAAVQVPQEDWTVSMRCLNI